MDGAFEIVLGVVIGWHLCVCRSFVVPYIFIVIFGVRNGLDELVCSGDGAVGLGADILRKVAYFARHIAARGEVIQNVVRLHGQPIAGVSAEGAGERSFALVGVLSGRVDVIAAAAGYGVFIVVEVGIHICMLMGLRGLFFVARLPSFIVAGGLSADIARIAAGIFARLSVVRAACRKCNAHEAGNERRQEFFHHFPPYCLIVPL